MKCNICNSKKIRKDNFATSMLSLKNTKFGVFRCDNCKIEFLYPQLTTEELKNLYSTNYFSLEDSPKHTEKYNAPKTDYINDLASVRVPKFKRTLIEFKKINNNYVKLLDVGAATGDFMKIASDLNFDVDGIEYSKYAIQKAFELYNLNIQNIELSEIKLIEHYDIVHLNHVFEHFNNPKQELKYIYNVLVKNGLLYIEIPYQFSLIHKISYFFRDKNSNANVHSLHHPFFYTPSSLIQILVESGFKVKKVSVFDKNRLNNEGILNKFKYYSWYILSHFKIGNFIEIYALKK